MRAKFLGAVVILVLCLLPDAARSATFDWRFMNRAGETIYFELYSQSRNNLVWPGSGGFWTIPPNGRLTAQRISCQRGEHICYGAWTENGTWWGVGKGDAHRCSDCCYHCNGGSSRVIAFNAAPARAAPVGWHRCFPRDLGPRIFASADSNDIHPQWGSSGAIGTAWSLNDVTVEGAFMRGTLATPRGNEQPGEVYVLAAEWDCE